MCIAWMSVFRYDRLTSLTPRNPELEFHGTHLASKQDMCTHKRHSNVTKRLQAFVAGLSCVLMPSVMWVLTLPCNWLCSACTSHHIVLDPAIKPLSLQAEGFKPKQRAKQAQHSGSNSKSPPQASRKRKAQHASLSTASTAPTSAGDRHTANRKGQTQARAASQHNRLKSAGRRQKEPVDPPADTPPSIAPAASNVMHTEQLDTAKHRYGVSVGTPLIPDNTIEAHVSGVPHTHLVQQAMQHLSHTLSNVPQATDAAQAADVNATQAPGAAQGNFAGLSSAVARQGGQATSARPRILSAAQPVLQPFLSATAGQQQILQNSSAMNNGSSQPERVALPVAGEVHAKLHQPSPQQESAQQQAREGVQEQAEQLIKGNTGGQAGQLIQGNTGGRAEQLIKGKTYGQAEGTTERQTKGQTKQPAEACTNQQPDQAQTAASAEPCQEQCKPQAQPDGALQQLISRAQKLKQQLDAHAERRATSMNQQLTPPVLFSNPQSAPPTHPLSPLWGPLQSVQLPAVQSALPWTDLLSKPQDRAAADTANAHALGLLTSKAPDKGSLNAASVPDMPLYTADAYGLMTGSVPHCGTWPAEKHDGAALNSSMTLPGDGGAIAIASPTTVGGCMLVTSHSHDGSSVSSDPAALVEDALLGELFFPKPEGREVRASNVACLAMSVHNSWSHWHQHEDMHTYKEHCVMTH